ncbi:MAG: Rhs family protein, partial [Acidobacteria bacterium]
SAGHCVIWIDGTTANTPKKSYGLFEVGVDIVAGQTNVLNYTIWMPLLDMAHAVTIPSPTQSEVVVTTPALPGLELHIPPQTTILDRKGNVVTQVSITPVPVKQPPFPLPKDVLVPLYFTIQPGGAYIQVANENGPQGARLYYPNTYHYPAGAVFNFYNYNADDKGWYVYGQGRVSSDRSQVIPNPGVAVYEFTGAMVSNPSNAPPNGPTPGDPPGRGDPVDLQTGLFVYKKTDLTLSDVIPLVLTRTYRPNDYISRAFGIGTNHNYDMFIVGPNDGGPFPAGYTYQDLILSDGGRIHFTRTSPCTGFCNFSDAILTATSTTTDFYGATITWNSCGFNGASWCLKKKDGTVFGFPDSTNSTVSQAAAPIGMRDRYGNSLTFTRDGSHNLTQITSPSGRWIQFTYDTSNRITQAKDNIGRTVGYTYDPSGRLSTVTDANSGLWTYTYDINNNMLTIKDARQIVYLTNYYDANNRVYEQVQADNGTYLYSYTLDQNGNVTQTNVTDPRGNVEQVAFNSDGFVTSDTFAVGKPEQQIITYNRQLGSGLVQSVADALGRTTSYSYDPMGSVTSVTRLAGTQNAVTTNFAYESTFNRLTAVTDPLGHKTSFSYDTSGNLVAIVNPLGNSTSLVYNSAGRPVSVTDPVGNTSQFAYDSGDLVGTTDPLGRTVSRFVDSAGRL